MKGAKMREFDDLVVVITGGGRGIGAATARQLAEQGARVFICGRTESELRETAQSASGISWRALDIRDEEAVNEWVESIGEEMGRVDVLINNASILGPRARLDETEVDAWRATLDINITGTFLMTRAAYPWLRKSEYPLVINLSSSVGRRGRASWGAYSISKFGAEGLAEVAAEELADAQAAVISLNPGGTATKMRAQAYPEEDPQVLPAAEEVAETITLLVALITPAENGAKYSSRQLFGLVGRPPASAKELPRDDF